MPDEVWMGLEESVEYVSGSSAEPHLFLNVRKPSSVKSVLPKSNILNPFSQPQRMAVQVSKWLGRKL